MRGATVPVALFVLLAFLSCGQEPDRKIPQSVVADAKSAFVIMDNLPLWTLSNGSLTSKETVPIGEKLHLLGQC